MKKQLNRQLSRRLQSASFEALEKREMYSVTLSGETLMVVGTNAADQVTITQDPANAGQLVVTVNGTPASFDMNAVTGINVNLLKGDDRFSIDQTNGKIAIPATVFGGDGNDLITGGTGNDSIDGGAGNDTINGDAGDDILLGSAGNDSINGGSGDDQIDGGAGTDMLNGGADSDTVTGGAGSDQLNGGSGDDQLDGSGGSNKLTGGTGADAFAKGTGGTNKYLDDTAGVDRLYQPFPMSRMPQKYLDMFNKTFPNSIPLGYQVNNDNTWTMLYRFNGDNNSYHAFFSYPGGGDPFADLSKVDLVKYEVAPTNLPPNTLAAFQQAYPDAIIKEVYADHDPLSGKFAMIRIKTGDSDSTWVRADWLDND